MNYDGLSDKQKELRARIQRGRTKMAGKGAKQKKRATLLQVVAADPPPQVNVAPPPPQVNANVAATPPQNDGLVADLYGEKPSIEFQSFVAGAKYLTDDEILEVIENGDPIGRPPRRSDHKVYVIQNTDVKRAAGVALGSAEKDEMDEEEDAKLSANEDDDDSFIDDSGLVAHSDEEESLDNPPTDLNDVCVICDQPQDDEEDLLCCDTTQEGIRSCQSWYHPKCISRKDVPPKECDWICHLCANGQLEILGLNGCGVDCCGYEFVPSPVQKKQAAAPPRRKPLTGVARAVEQAKQNAESKAAADKFLLEDDSDLEDVQKLAPKKSKSESEYDSDFDEEEDGLKPPRRKPPTRKSPAKSKEASVDSELDEKEDGRKPQARKSPAKVDNGDEMELESSDGEDSEFEDAVDDYKPPREDDEDEELVAEEEAPKKRGRGRPKDPTQTNKTFKLRGAGVPPSQARQQLDCKNRKCFESLQGPMERLQFQSIPETRSNRYDPNNPEHQRKRIQEERFPWVIHGAVCYTDQAPNKNGAQPELFKEPTLHIWVGSKEAKDFLERALQQENGGKGLLHSKVIVRSSYQEYHNDFFPPQNKTANNTRSRKHVRSLAPKKPHGGQGRARKPKSNDKTATDMDDTTTNKRRRGAARK